MATSLQSLSDHCESLRPSLDLPQNNIILKNNNNVKELIERMLMSSL